MTDKIDPKGLILEAYRMEGITLQECRSIFLDWALSLPDGADQPAAVHEIHQRFAADHPTHPMSEVISEGLSDRKVAKRRGGWRGRRPN